MRTSGSATAAASGGPVSTPVAITASQASIANITGFTRFNDAKFVSAPTDANSKLTATGIAGAGVTYMAYGAVDTAMSYRREVFASDDYASVFRLGMDNPLQVGDKGTVGGLYSAIGVPLVVFWLSNRGGGAYRMRYITNNNVIFDNALNDLTAAQAKAGVWCRHRLVNRTSVVAEMHLGGSATEPARTDPGWKAAFSSSGITAYASWIECFNVFQATASTDAPVGWFANIRTITNSIYGA